MDCKRLIEEFASNPHTAHRLAHVAELPPRPAQWAVPERPLHPRLEAALAVLGIERLYLHQAKAIDLARRGEDLVVVTGTASGKTLCYNIPVVEALLADEGAHALYIYPTKALTQDQLRGLMRLLDAGGFRDVVRPGIYDGDTPPGARRRIREESNAILTNPDMLHVSILPYHGKWSRLFGGLRYVVVDEVHSYRGIFGSNVANVLRRLLRVCEHHGSHPTFVMSSATIANPGELASRLIGRPVKVVDEDGSPRGRKFFVLWNPPFVDETKTLRRSANIEAQALLTELVSRGVQTILFTRARVVAELIYRYAREHFLNRRSALADKLAAYRGGYLPEERREIERRLFSGELLGVASTNALELGIDVGSLDACILVGYPGTVASTLQQAGRAGRALGDSLAILVAYDNPIDQYIIRHPEYLLGASPEEATIDPENPYILAHHLSCAMAEIALSEEDLARFGQTAQGVVDALVEGGLCRRLAGRVYWARPEVPQSRVNLRTISDDTYEIQETRTREVIGQVDSISALEIVHPGAVYLHAGETYLVRELDLEGKVAYVERADVDYYTQAVLSSRVHLDEELERRELPLGTAAYCRVTVAWSTVGFNKFRFYTMENVGYGTLELPTLELETRAVCLVPPPAAMARLASAGFRPFDALAGVRNLFLSVLPALAMCDRTDVGGVLDSSNLGVPAVFVYDRFQGGLGFAQRAYLRMEELLARCLEVVEECPCEAGCPSCVGLVNLRPPVHGDLDLDGGRPIPDKEAARALLRVLVHAEEGSVAP